MKDLKDLILEAKSYGWSKNKDVDLIMACMHYGISKAKFKENFDKDDWYEMKESFDEILSAVENFVGKYKSKFRIYGIFQNSIPFDKRIKVLKDYSDQIILDAAEECTEDIVSDRSYGFCGQNDDGSKIYNDGAGDCPMVIIGEE